MTDERCQMEPPDAVLNVGSDFSCHRVYGNAVLSCLIRRNHGDLISCNLESSLHSPNANGMSLFIAEC